MAATPLFTDAPATDVFYRNLRHATNEYTRKALADCQALWEIYEPFADPEFTTELRSNFDARYWEMYLTTVLIREGYEVCCPKPGPDVGIKFKDRRIWFEATSPTRGADNQADQVPAQRVVAPGDDPVVQDVPNEKLVLRYLNSISVKNDQYTTWLKDGIVAPDEAFVIASIREGWASSMQIRNRRASFRRHSLSEVPTWSLIPAHSSKSMPAISFAIRLPRHQEIQCQLVCFTLTSIPASVRCFARE